LDVKLEAQCDLFKVFTYVNVHFNVSPGEIPPLLRLVYSMFSQKVISRNPVPFSMHFLGLIWVCASA